MHETLIAELEVMLAELTRWPPAYGPERGLVFHRARVLRDTIAIARWLGRVFCDGQELGALLAQRGLATRAA